MAHKAGFVNIIGNPNVGKSTLMNRMVGEKLSIITSKSQTTRHRIMGIVNGEDFQIVYSDTPGIINPNYQLQESMMKFVSTAMLDADIVLYVTDVYETADKNQKMLDRIKQTDVPILLIINKIDQSNQEELEVIYQHWKDEMPDAEIFPISALHKFNIENVLKRIIELLPENEPYFPKDQMTDKSDRFFVSEIIREKILVRYKKEIPYSVEIVVEEFKEEEKIIRIRAIIYVIRDSQKGIIIGHKGVALKSVGIDARKDMEAFLGKHVYLEMYVKVNKDWRDSKDKLTRFGYNE